MGIANLLDRILGRSTPETSKDAAKDRLKLVLMHDRSDIPATMMEAIRAEMIQVLSKYVEIDTEALEVQLEREQGAIGLVLNIPIRRVKSEAEAADALAAMHAFQTGKGLATDIRERDERLAVEAKESAIAARDAKDTGELAFATGDFAEAEGGDKPRNTGELKAGGTGDLAAERAEPND